MFQLIAFIHGQIYISILFDQRVHWGAPLQANIAGIETVE